MNRIRWAPMGADGDHSERYCAAGAKCLARGVRLAAEEQAQRRPGIAGARAYEIEKVNHAVASNPSYMQLAALKALQAVLEAPAAKVCLLNSDSPMPRARLGDPVPRGAKD